MKGVAGVASDEREAESGSERFLGGAYRRMAWLMVTVAVLAAPVLAVFYNWRLVAGFAGGALAAIANLYWLKASVGGFADAVTATGPQSSAGMVAKFLLRYGLLALIVYVIFQSSGQVVYGFIAGLFVPVSAMMCEAAYEAWSALRHHDT
jgi:hypothetical protein